MSVKRSKHTKFLMRIPGLFVTLSLVFAFLPALSADPASDAHPRVSIENDHLTLTFERAPGPDLYIVELSDELAQWHSGEAFTETVSTVPGPGGTQTVRVRSRSLVSVKPKEFMRLRVIVDPHSPVVYLSGLHYAWNTANAQLAARVLGVEAAHLTSLALNGSALPVQAGDFLLNVTLTAGVNTFTLIATDDQGVPGQAVAKVLLDTVAPVIAITAPHPVRPSRSVG